MKVHVPVDPTQTMRPALKKLAESVSTAHFNLKASATLYPPIPYDLRLLSMTDHSNNILQKAVPEAAPGPSTFTPGDEILG